MTRDHSQLALQLEREGEEAKLVLMMVALQLTQHIACEETFSLLGHHYSITSCPDTQEIVIRLQEASVLLTASVALLPGLCTLVGL